MAPCIQKPGFFIAMTYPATCLLCVSFIAIPEFNIENMVLSIKIPMCMTGDAIFRNDPVRFGLYHIWLKRSLKGRGHARCSGCHYDNDAKNHFKQLLYSPLAKTISTIHRAYPYICPLISVIIHRKGKKESNQCATFLIRDINSIASSGFISISVIPNSDSILLFSPALLHIP